MPYAIGQASAFLYCLRQRPALFRSATEVLGFARDCHMLADYKVRARVGCVCVCVCAGGRVFVCAAACCVPCVVLCCV